MYARMMLGLAVAYLGDTDAGERELVAALGAADDLCHPDDMLYGRLYLGEVLRLGGRIEDALAVMLDGRQQARLLGMDGAFGGFMTLNAAMDLLFLGRWEQADAWIAAVPDTPALAEWDTLLRQQIAGQLCVVRGDWEPAERQLSRARASCQGAAPPEFAPAVFAAIAELALWRGRVDDANAAIAEGLEIVGDRMELLHAPALFAMGARVGADLVQGNPGVRAPSDSRVQNAAPRALCEQLTRLIEARGDGVTAPIARAYLATCRAEAARAEGGPAVPLWGEAAAAWQALASPYARAYASWRQAEAMLAIHGARGAAARTLSDAHRTAGELGAAPLRREIELLARRSRIDLTDASPSPAHASSSTATTNAAGLTDRELEVLQLIAEGLTNGEIAERLFISPRTAGVHVSHILAKLNASNRASAAAAAHRLGLLRAASN
jgi:DNA-binding CsgD family transcriptional regulator